MVTCYGMWSNHVEFLYWTCCLCPSQPFYPFARLLIYSKLFLGCVCGGGVCLSSQTSLEVFALPFLIQAEMAIKGIQHVYLETVNRVWSTISCKKTIFYKSFERQNMFIAFLVLISRILSRCAANKYKYICKQIYL